MDVHQEEAENSQKQKEYQEHLIDDDDDDFVAGNSGNIILYIGLGMMAVGLIITFVGLGRAGFNTIELKLAGPSLVAGGMVLAIMRLLCCTVIGCVGTDEEEEILLTVDRQCENTFYKLKNKNAVQYYDLEDSVKDENVPHPTQEGGEHTKSGEIILNHTRLYVDPV